MNESFEDRVEEIAQEASQLAGEAREQFLAEACGNDRALRDAVMKTVADIEADARDPDFWRPHVATQPSEPPTLPAGFRIDDFEIVRELGRGGMHATVYLARQVSLARDVALKVLVEGFDTSPREIERFHRSAKAAARLHHRGIVPVHAVGSAGNAHYFAMEYVAGHDLGKELAARRRPDSAGPMIQPVLPERGARAFTSCALQLCREVADALQHAHEHHVVHRDIKPQNLMVDAQGGVHIVDFGLAHDGNDARENRVTRTGAIIGTVAYMSPEQAQAQRNTIDHRTDIYSLGAVLYELLSGRQPFRGDSAIKVLNAIVAGDPEPLAKAAPGVPGDVALVCEKAMAKSPADRYATAAQFAEDLDCLLALKQPKWARAPSVGQRLQRLLARHRNRLAAIAVMLLVVAATVLLVSHEAHAANLHRLLTDLTPLRSDIAVSFEQALAAKRSATELRASKPSPAVALAITEAERGLERFHADEAAGGREDLLLGMGQGRNDYPGNLRLDLILLGARRLRDAARLFPERTPPAFAVEADYLPKLSVTAKDELGRAVTGRVELRYLDPQTGEPGPRVEVGTLPLSAIGVTPGYARVVVTVDGRGAREFTRSFWHLGDTVQVDVSLDPRQDTTTGMVRLGSAPRRTPGKVPYVGVPVEAFLLDEAEVTVGQYREFARVTGRADPLATLGPAPTQYDDHPMVLVSWEDAVAYAEWVGKRLPSAAEWDWAAHGLEDRAFPTAPAPDDGHYGNGLAALESGKAGSQVDIYLRLAKPVRRFPGARTPEGVYELLGNVQEFTESMAAEQGQAGWEPRGNLRWTRGADWSARAHGATLRANGITGTGRDFVSNRVGFRCAKSI